PPSTRTTPGSSLRRTIPPAAPAGCASRVRSRSSPPAGTQARASPMRLGSSAKLRQGVNVFRDPPAEDADDDPEAHHDLARRHDHHHEGEDLPVAVAPHA